MRLTKEEKRAKEFDRIYMGLAEQVASLSRAERLKVGCVMVKDHIVIYGFNGTPPGQDNCCEYMASLPNGTFELKTKPNVIHAEINAIAKFANSTVNSEGATVYLTHSPCPACATALVAAKVGKVIWKTMYRDDEGLTTLRYSRIKEEQYVED